MQVLKSATIVFIASIFATSLWANEPQTDGEKWAWIEENATIARKNKMPMRDGVRLSTDIFVPKEAAESGDVPTVFWRTPYNFNTYTGTRLTFLYESLKRGYAFVVQNERGRFFSEGTFEILGYPRTDGYDALSWIADQPWSNGKVGTVGCSSSAEWQLALAAQDHPAHAAAIPMAPGAGIGRVGAFQEQGNWYKGGVAQFFYIPWLYGLNDTVRPSFPPDTPPETLQYLSKFWDLAPKRQDIDWANAVNTVPWGTLMDRLGGPIGHYQRMSRRAPGDKAWFDGGLYHDNEAWGVPTLWMNSWYDVSISPNLALYGHAQKAATDPETADQQYLIIAPTAHCGFYRIPKDEPLIVGERSMGVVDFPVFDKVFGFLDATTKDEGDFFETQPKVEYFVQSANAWQTAENWPIPGAEDVTFYLTSGDGANSSAGDGALISKPQASDGMDLFTYDPMTPVLTVGGGVCCNGGVADPGSYDQRATEARQDVLVYTTEPLETDMEVSGPVTVTLFVGSDAPDTDFTVKLVDVAPDGQAMNLDDTIQRVRYREGYDKEVMMEPGKIYELAVSPMSTSNLFEAGHRIRIEVSSSSFPHYNRNMNQGTENIMETVPRIANNEIHHGKSYPSRITLPVVRR